MNSLVGTEEFLAPETLTDSNLTYATDYWSLGVIVFQLLFNTTPFQGRNDLETFQNIKNCAQIHFPEHIKVSDKAKDFIRQLLVSDSQQRLGHQSIEEIMEHQFFKGVDWSSLRETKVPYNPPKRPIRSAQVFSTFSRPSNYISNSPLGRVQSPSILSQNLASPQPKHSSKFKSPASCSDYQITRPRNTNEEIKNQKPSQNATRLNDDG